jgi:hypothetical protein
MTRVVQTMVNLLVVMLWRILGQRKVAKRVKKWKVEALLELCGGCLANAKSLKRAPPRIVLSLK